MAKQFGLPHEWIASCVYKVEILSAPQISFHQLSGGPEVNVICRIAEVYHLEEEAFDDDDIGMIIVARCDHKTFPTIGESHFAIFMDFYTPRDGHMRYCLTKPHICTED